MAMMADSKHLSRLSRLLSRILRHEALERGLPMTADGFVPIDALFALKEFSGCTVDDVRLVVMSNAKQRFEFDSRDHPTRIRAVQGHSIAIIEEELLLDEIHDPAAIPICIHGTYHRCMDGIMRDGLRSMRRTHIHMADGLPHEVRSGARKDVELLIYINVPLAMADGIKFFRSKNGVLLTRGLEDGGALPARYFEKVVAYRRPDRRDQGKAKQVDAAAVQRKDKP